jgi:hypothetical protein
MWATCIKIRPAGYRTSGVDVARPPPPRVPYQHLHQPGERSHSRPPEMAVGDAFRYFSAVSHLVWGRVVPDIPAFYRELVEALADE